MRHAHAFLLTTTLLVGATAALAEPPPGPGPAGPFAGKREEMRARVEQKIKTYLTVELASRLALDQKRALQLGDAVQRHMERKHQRGEKMRTEADKLRELVEKKAPDAAVKSQLDMVVGLAGKDDDLHAFLGDTGKFLNVTEQAKLALSMPEIMRDVHRLVREAKREFRGRGPGPGPGHDDDE
ncbi:MAG: hypothetical protein HYS27_14185 [Deltaproteobacteria bacterium]|nr:hypothetical protein [Deltaproteobacteria bacterium]